MRQTKLQRALEEMRQDGRLVRFSTDEYYIIPSYRRIDKEMAEKIKAHPSVRGQKDSLFPGMDQTWRMQ